MMQSASGSGAGGVAPFSPPPAPPVIRFAELKVLSKLGDGSYGVALLCRWEAEGKEVAVKLFKDDADRSEFQTELQHLSTLPHKNVVSLLGVCPDAPAAKYQCNSPYGLVLEFMDRGNLNEYVHKRQLTQPQAASNAQALFPTWRHLNLRQRVNLAMEAAQGLRALHKYNVVHRDVKPANLLLDNMGSLKWADFGTAQRRREGVGTIDLGAAEASMQPGTIAYMAPEILVSLMTGRPIVYSRKIDVYSLGLTLYELLTGRDIVPQVESIGDFMALVILGCRPPWPKASDEDYDGRTPACLKRLVVAAWHSNPAKRPSADDAAQYLKKVALELLKLERKIGAEAKQEPPKISSQQEIDARVEQIRIDGILRDDEPAADAPAAGGDAAASVVDAAAASPPSGFSVAAGADMYGTVSAREERRQMMANLLDSDTMPVKGDVGASVSDGRGAGGVGSAPHRRFNLELPSGSDGLQSDFVTFSATAQDAVSQVLSRADGLLKAVSEELPNATKHKLQAAVRQAQMAKEKLEEINARREARLASRPSGAPAASSSSSVLPSSLSSLSKTTAAGRALLGMVQSSLLAQGQDRAEEEDVKAVCSLALAVAATDAILLAALQADLLSKPLLQKHLPLEARFMLAQQQRLAEEIQQVVKQRLQQ